MTEVCSLCRQVASGQRGSDARQIDCAICGAFRITHAAHERLASAPDDWLDAFRTQLRRVPAGHSYFIEIPKRRDGSDYEVPVGRVVPVDD